MNSSHDDHGNVGTGESFSHLQQKVSTLNLTLQQKFWAWFSVNLQKFLNKDSSEFYDVMLSSNPNPLSTPVMAETAGALAIVGRVIRLLVVPIQKIMQYYEWLNAPEGSEARKKKPKFTREDAFYLGLDIVLLGLTAAAFFSGASIPGAAIALTAAAISFGVAAFQFASYLYEGYKIKQEKQQVDELRDRISAKPDAILNEKDKDFIQEQRKKLGALSDLPVLDVLNKRSETLGERLKQSIASRYQNVKKSLGFGLTMLGIVSASLILAGLLLGPVGAPVIMAGVGLSIATLVIAGGMIAVNTIKESREEKKKKIGKRVIPDMNDDLHAKKSGVHLSSTFRNRKQAAAVEKADAQNDIELEGLVTPYMQSDSSVVKSSIFNRTVKAGETELPHQVKGHHTKPGKTGG